MDRWLERFANAVFLRSSDTSHDLKTPLNIAVLNLELLRMRVRKIAGDDDPKILEYSSAVELELRRMGKIFDAFFVLSTPPKGDGAPPAVDIGPIIADVADDAGYGSVAAGNLHVVIHESRIRQALQMFFDGASRLFAREGRELRVENEGAQLRLSVSGRPDGEDVELTRLFKFYYTDSSGNPDIALAAARLIVETYGGELNAVGESDKVSLQITLPTR